MAELPPELAARGGDTLWVANKVDLQPNGRPDMRPGGMSISAKTGHGIDELTRRVAAIARERLGTDEHPALTHIRHRSNLESCLEFLVAFLRGGEQQLELRAEDLRQAANALGRLTGKVDPEEVLDQIFKRFCIGK
jgi:tRNA modification GTPase